MCWVWRPPRPQTHTPLILTHHRSPQAVSDPPTQAEPKAGETASALIISSEEPSADALPAPGAGNSSVAITASARTSGGLEQCVASPLTVVPVSCLVQLCQSRVLLIRSRLI